MSTATYSPVQKVLMFAAVGLILAWIPAGFIIHALTDYKLENTLGVCAISALLGFKTLMWLANASQPQSTQAPVKKATGGEVSMPPRPMTRSEWENWHDRARHESHKSRLIFSVIMALGTMILSYVYLEREDPFLRWALMGGSAVFMFCALYLVTGRSASYGERELEEAQLSPEQVTWLERHKTAAPIRDRLARIQASEVAMMNLDWNDLLAVLEDIAHKETREETAQRLLV